MGRHKVRNADRFGTSCFFCGEPIHKGAGVNKHHIIPKRYGMKTQLHLAHEECHRRAHCEHDNPQWSLDEFLAHMEPKGFLHGIFAEEEALVCT